MINISARKVTKSVVPEKAIKVVYCLYRVSTKSQVEENDIPMQRSACRDFVSRKPGWFIKREFMELGVSGFKTSANDRDQLQELKACAERKEFDVLLVFMFDRLGRRDDETPFVLRWFAENGIEIWSVKEGQQIFDSSVDYLINYMRFWSANAESKNTSMRVRTKLRQMVEEGKYTGGTVPFGYRLVPGDDIGKNGRIMKKIVVVPGEAEIVKLIFQKTTDEGTGSYVMASMLNSMGIKTHKGAKFAPNTVNRILRNPLYCGFFFRGGVLSTRVSELQFIDDSVYNEAQRILEGRAYKNKQKEKVANHTKATALLGGNVFCGNCGQRMNITCHTYTYITAAGEKHFRRYSRYMCAGKVMCRNQCTGQGTFSVRNVDSMIEDHLQSLLSDNNDTGQEEMLETNYCSVVNSMNQRINDLKQEQEAISGKLRIMYAEVADSISGISEYSPEVLSEAISRARERQAEVKEDLNRLLIEVSDTKQLKASIGYRFAEYKRLLKRFFEDKVSLEEKRMIVNKLFAKVVIQRGKKDQYDIQYHMRNDYVDFLK